MDLAAHYAPNKPCEMNALAVFLGGGLGSVARYGIGLYTVRWTSTFPWGTLMANVLATVLLVGITNWLAPQAGHLSRHQQTWLLFATTGFCGAFSTFSTFSQETIQLWASGAPLAAAANIAISVGGCLAIGWLIWRSMNA